MAPLIGITTDCGRTALGTRRYESACAYARAVAAAGGVPVLLAQETGCIASYLELCRGFLFTGGDDPRMELFGRGLTTAPQAHPMDEGRQRFEMALLEALATHCDRPVLGICWGMQLMALMAGGILHQHLPEVLGPAAEEHRGNKPHGVVITAPASVLFAGQGELDSSVVSCHHQAVDSPGTLRIAARAPDQVIEAVDDPQRRFYAGVQWHPERREDGPLNLGVISAFVAAAAGR